MQEFTTSNIWTEVGTTITGFFTAAGNFFTALWGNPMGKIVVTLGLASGAIGLCYKLFLRKKQV